MAIIAKLRTKFTSGAWLNDVKHYFSKTNEIIDALNDVAPLAPNYYVWTGKVTQVQSEQDSGVLTVGKYYIVDSLEVGDNFVNVGYVSEGVAFLATGTTPTTWTNGTVVINVEASQPSVILLQDTYGDVVVAWEYGIGTTFRKTGAFPATGFFTNTANLSRVNDNLVKAVDPGVINIEFKNYI